METLISLLIGAGLIEIYAWLDPLAKWLVRRAAKTLPAQKSEAFAEQFLADVEAMPNSVAKLYFALRNCTFAASAIRQALHREALLSVAARFDGVVERFRDYDRFVERQRTVLEEVRTKQLLLLEQVDRTLASPDEFLENGSADLIGRVLALKPELDQSLADVCAEAEEFQAMHEKHAAAVRSTKMVQTNDLLQRRALDERPIASADLELLRSVVPVLNELMQVYNQFENPEPSDFKSAARAQAMLNAMDEAIKAANSNQE
jgi:hypothetical protein